MNGLLRHIHACNNAVLPGDRRPLLVSGEQVGWVKPDIAEHLLGLGASPGDRGIELRPDQLQPFARKLAEAGALHWRDEPFDVRATRQGPVLGQLDRGALPKFGVAAAGVHLNGLVRGGGETKLWVGLRSKTKRLDPAKLDHLVAGGIPAGHDAESTLIKEGAEEAGLPPDLARRAVPVGLVSYAFEREEGLRRDWLYCYDLDLPPNFVPHPHDDEVERFELWELSRALETVRETDRFKFNVNLVLIDLFIRLGAVSGDEAAALRRALSQPARGA